MKKNTTGLLTKEIDRKEFLLYLGVLFLAITGISGFMNNLSSITKEPPSKGFGRGSYGA